MSLYKSLLEAISKDSETEVMRFLKTAPEILLSTFNYGWNSTGWKSEFSLGNEFRSDFVLLGVHSGGWEITFIELESPAVKLFTKNKTPRKELNVAIRQVKEWSDWIEKNREYARKQLAIVAEENEMCPPALYKIHLGPGESIRDPETYINFRYRIVIGRSSLMTKEDQKYRNIYCQEGTEIATYDRLLEKAKVCDEANMLLNERKKRVWPRSNVVVFKMYF